MSKKYIMSIDQGTTGSTVSLVDRGGGLVAQQSQDFPQIFPQPGWVEHDPEEIWKSVTDCIKKLLTSSQIQTDEIAGIGITNQRETVLLWDRKTHKPIYNAIVWQCRRTQDFCAELKKKKKDKMIFKKTGLVTDPYFSGSKIRWLLKNVSGASAQAKNGSLAAGTIDSFLVYRLTDGKKHVTDVSNASRTMLMNLESLKWDQELLKLFSISSGLLPEIVDSSGIIGETSGLDFLPNGIPIAGIAGDQQSALFGQTCFAEGDVKCTFGTGSFILLNTSHKVIRSKHRLLTTVAWRLPKEKPVYALEGSVFVCGAAVQWLRDGLGLVKSSSEVENLAKQVEDSGGVHFVPALTGLGAPHWNPEARGIITGLTRGSTKAHIARATLEAMALQNVDLLEAMRKDLGKKLKSIRVDGGAAANSLLMQMQADYSGVKVERPKQIESTSMGAAYLAGIGVGFWNSKQELAGVWKIDKEFDPKLKNNLKNQKITAWHQAIEKA